jgi:CRISPR/Cas system-associated exonuclease Cas4 (RecB family)
MVKDKYSAVWVSHSSISDFLKCPRAYYINNVYRDPKTNSKVTLMQPPLALGQVVHQVIESQSVLPVEQRLHTVTEQFEKAWEQVTGTRGGFRDEQEEQEYKARGYKMMENVKSNPGPLQRKAIKLRKELPYFWLSEEFNIILCGKIDWLEYIPEVDGVRIIDFKTGKYDEDPDSMQLPIYYLLAKNSQERPVVKVSYWYIERDQEPIDMLLPQEQDAIDTVLEVAKRIVVARKLDQFTCRQKDGCFACNPLEKILEGKAEFVGIGNYKQQIYILP